tara:strand:- start:109 stop:333 length:225 start_codon:yes stop_codon:yes gene_type:complete
MPTKTVVDCSTGITTEVELTAEEVAEIEAMRQRAEEEQAAADATAAQKAADRESGNAKLKELGLTDDEIAALVG